MSNQRLVQRKRQEAESQESFEEEMTRLLDVSDEAMANHRISIERLTAWISLHHPDLSTWHIECGEPEPPEHCKCDDCHA